MSRKTDDQGEDSDRAFLDDVLNRLYDFGKKKWSDFKIATKKRLLRSGPAVHGPVEANQTQTVTIRGVDGSWAPPYIVGIRGGGDTDESPPPRLELCEGDGSREKNKRKSRKSKKSNEVESTPADGGIVDSVGSCTTSLEQNIAADLDSLPKSCKVGNMTPPVKRAAEVEIVTFQNPSKKKKAGKPPAPKIERPLPAEKRAEQKDFSLEKARLEVHRFGITGYQKEQQRLFEQERAVMLGAKPPKREYVNYKVYQQMIKEKKQKAKEEPKLDNNKKKRQTKERSEKGKSSSKSVPTGQVGRFKNGMLVLSTKEIQRIKSSKVIK